jgi:hypothetical protein
MQAFLFKSCDDAIKLKMEMQEKLKKSDQFCLEKERVGVNYTINSMLLSYFHLRSLEVKEDQH